MSFFKRDNNDYDNINNDKQLELRNMELKAQLEGLKNYANESEKNNTQLKLYVTNFCRSLLEREFALSQIGGNDENILQMDIPQLLSFTAKKIIDRRNEQNNQMLDIITEAKTKENIIEDLKNQITIFLSNKNLSSKEILEIVMDKKISKTEEKYSMEEAPSTQEKIKDDKNTLTTIIDNPMVNRIKEPKKESNIIPISVSTEKQQSPVKIIEIKDEDLIEKKNLKRQDKVNDNSSEDKIIAHVIDLSQIMKNMAEINWDLLWAIGGEGLSDKNDILALLSENDKYKDIEKDSLDQKIDEALKQMKVSNLVMRDKVNTGWRTFYVYSLSDTGKRVFKESEKFKDKEIVACERDLLAKQHCNPNHGYGIKDCSNILTELGYTEVSYDSKTNKTELPNGDIYIPDIIAKDPLLGEKQYFEYELVHHKQSDFDIKCNKMMKLTKHLYFIVPDVKKREKILLQIDDWRFKMGEKIKNVQVSVTTTRNLKKNKWEDV